MKMSPDTSNPQRDRPTFAAAVKFAALFIAIAVVAFVAAIAWLQGCKMGTGQGALDNCNALQRNTLAIGPSAVLFVGGVWAFVRTYTTWRARGSWWIWQGAGWFLLVLMLVVLTTSAPLALLS
jgi:hypothetical protein